MKILNMASQCKWTRHSNAVAAGQTVITPSTSIDMLGFKGCVFEVAFGAIDATAVTSVEVHSSSDNGSSDAFAIITGTNVVVAADQDNKLVICEVVNPAERYLKCIVNRGTADATVDNITAIQWGGRNQVPTQSTTVSGRDLNVGGVDTGLS